MSPDGAAFDVLHPVPVDTGSPGPGYTMELTERSPAPIIDAPLMVLMFVPETNGDCTEISVDPSNDVPLIVLMLFADTKTS